MEFIIASRLEYSRFGDIFYSVPEQSEIDSAYQQIEEFCKKQLFDKYGHWKQAEERLMVALDFLKRTNLGFEYLILKTIAELCTEEKSIVFIESLSIIDYLMGLTMVNPLTPHYYCPKCHRVEEVDNVNDGFDLPEKLCPDCKIVMNKDGHNCPEYLNWRESGRSRIGYNIEPVKIRFTSRILQKLYDRLSQFYGCKSDKLKYYSISFYADTLLDMIDFLDSRTGILHSEIPLYDKNIWYDALQIVYKDFLEARNIDKFHTVELPKKLTFYEIIRIYCYWDKIFIRKKDMSDLKETTYYVTREEVFEMFVNNGFDYEEATYNTCLIACGGDEEYCKRRSDLLSTMPERLKGNLERVPYLLPKYLYIFLFWRKYILAWYKKKYPKETESCESIYCNK